MKLVSFGQTPVIAPPAFSGKTARTPQFGLNGDRFKTIFAKDDSAENFAPENVLKKKHRIRGALIGGALGGLAPIVGGIALMSSGVGLPLGCLLMGLSFITGPLGFVLGAAKG